MTLHKGERGASRPVVALAAVLGVACIVGGAVWFPQASSRQEELATPVLVELFTSEGCSSCPPADALLMRLEAEQPVPGALIIALGEHVDYWNGLGWLDPFSSKAFTERQEVYRRALGEPANYTPQIVVDGRTAFVGSLEADARQAIAKAVASPKAEIQLQWTAVASDVVTIQTRIAGLPELPDGEIAELWLAVTETGLTTSVLRGENARRRLRHTAVTRRLERMEQLPAEMPRLYETDIAVPLDPLWNRDQLRVVGFIQEASSRKVIGASQLSLVPLRKRPCYATWPTRGFTPACAEPPTLRRLPVTTPGQMTGTRAFSSSNQWRMILSWVDAAPRSFLNMRNRPSGATS